MAKPENPPAFPCHVTGEQWNENVGNYLPVTYAVGGMSLRDWFAGQALAGWLSAGAVNAIIAVRGCDEATAQWLLSEGCYSVADAMLSARARPTPAGDE